MDTTTVRTPSFALIFDVVLWCRTSWDLEQVRRYTEFQARLLDGHTHQMITVLSAHAWFWEVRSEAPVSCKISIPADD